MWKADRIEERRTFIVIVAIIAIGAAATIATAYYLIETLDDNSQKLHKYEVKDTPVAIGNVIELIAISNNQDYQHRHPKASQFYDQAAKVEPTNVRKALELYKRCQEEHIKDTSLHQPVADDNFHMGLHYTCIGRCYLRLKDYDSAMTYANNALECDHSGTLYNFRAEVYTTLGKQELAEADRRTAQMEESTYQNARTSLKRVILSR